MNSQYTSGRRQARNSRRGKVLLALAAIVLFTGLFVQISMLARISGQNKRAASVEREIAALNANADNLELSINQYHNLDQIAVRAQQMGMEQPDETQIRVIRVAQNSGEDTSTQTAERIGGSEIMN